MSDYPRITIVTPSFNQSKYLRETIESILNQNYPNLEYIIIDGGSTDGSVEIIKEYEEHLDYWISEKDSGQSDAISKGFKRATGDWLNWINSDDALVPGALEAVAKAVAKYPKTDIIAGRGIIGQADGTVSRIVWPITPFMWMPKHAFYGQICQPSFFFRRKAYESIGGINTELFFRMDTDMYECMLSQGSKAVVINDILGFFRIQKNAKSTLNQDARKRELNERLSEFGISGIGMKLAASIVRLYRLCSVHYLRVYLATRTLHSQSLGSLWAKSRRARGSK
ncbi:MAG: glycosyltransferase [Planctomycetes bacterium]|nr:glycosyltransferase [Planctomycetota bacterium]